MLIQKCHGTMKARDGGSVHVQDELDDMGVFEGSQVMHNVKRYPMGMIQEKEKVKEDVPFDGMSLVQRMVSHG